MSTFYPAMGATGGATVGSLGGPALAGGGALIGYGVGKGAQIIDENKELKTTIQAISEGDVETIAKQALQQGMASQETKFQNFISKIEKWLIVSAVALALYLLIPIFVAHKTATKCSRSEARKISETRAPFPIKPSDNTGK